MGGSIAQCSKDEGHQYQLVHCRTHLWSGKMWVQQFYWFLCPLSPPFSFFPRWLCPRPCSMFIHFPQNIPPSPLFISGSGPNGRNILCKNKSMSWDFCFCLRRGKQRTSLHPSLHIWFLPLCVISEQSNSAFHHPTLSEGKDREEREGKSFPFLWPWF